MQETMRERIDEKTYADHEQVLSDLVAQAALSPKDRNAIAKKAEALVRDIRNTTTPGLMEVFLAEYGLSTDEGVALMCLAEALLRVPDADTIDALIEDKIAPSDWGHHLGQSTSSLVNASTWALMLTGRVLDSEKSPGPIGHLRAAIKRLGEPVIRTAVSRAMKEMGKQFVLGETIGTAMDRAENMQITGFTYSYDMLGEAALTDEDATRFHLSYSEAISAIAANCVHGDIRRNPGISVKLSALCPRYEVAQADSAIADLVPRLRALALLAKSAGMGLNVDAEEADRLALSVDVIEQVLSDPSLANWDGFGVVVQAFGPRAGAVIDELYAMAQKYDRKIMVRLVKGAYWDTEIKRAQVAGVDGFPVFTRKSETDVSYICNAKKLLSMTDRIYPQFATHNAHTVAAILHMAKDPDTFEFQRLHGMGETLHTLVLKEHGTRCRIYAPVGAHRDLLAYLVRRLLENGANSSFVNQIVDTTVPSEMVAADPFGAIEQKTELHISRGPDLFRPSRSNARGFDLSHSQTLSAIHAQREPFADAQWHATPLVKSTDAPGPVAHVFNPASPSDTVGTVRNATQAEVATASSQAVIWSASPSERQTVLERAAALYETHFGELFALLAREAGKTLPDCVAELREAVDFLHYYAAQVTDRPAAGIFTCVSPWNFPLAIFTGQISAALAAGNGVIAKPAEQTPLIAHRAVSLLHEAGVPRDVLQLLPGGAVIGAALTRRREGNGVAFTGSTQTALRIRGAMAENCRPGTPLIAETGGLNAMIVDSTALLEQAVKAIIESAFQSAGQRCSALRCLYVQKDVAKPLTKMLVGAMQCLKMGNPWDLATDVGPVIDEAARKNILEHIDIARRERRVLAELETPSEGCFVPPTLISVDGIGDLKKEVFGPVLHLATFEAADLDRVIDDINATGYGLTFGLQTRIDDRVQHIAERVEAGNLYINRNQIGAIVGSQPFGGEALSGTGPKAGGPHYLARFTAPDRMHRETVFDRQGSALPDVTKRKASVQGTLSLPGPTGESNRLSTVPRPALLCLGPGAETVRQQAEAVRELGGAAVTVDGMIDPQCLTEGPSYGGVLWWGDEATGRALESALAQREGPIIPLIPGRPDVAQVMVERHVCVDTTASGGNAALLGAMS